MAASSYTWAGKKLTPKELISSLRTDPLPLIVKVAQVPSEYEKSCPQMATGTVLWIYGSGQEERVALKTTADKTAKYISIPLEAPLKFEVVYTHERGPPTFLSSMLRGKVQSDLKVEMAGNTGNRLSSTPDEKQSVPYGTLQVVGIYKETVLQTQKIANGELNPLRRSLSVNCPVSLDIATGIYGKSADDFRKLKDRLKQNQLPKTTSQTDTSYDLVLLTDPPKSLQDFSQLRHACHLYGTVLADTAASSTPEEAKEKSGTFLGQALQQLQQSSKQENIPLVDKTSSLKSALLQSVPPSNTSSNEAAYDDAMSNIGKSWIKSSNTRCYYVTVDEPKQEPSEYENEFDKRISNSKSPGVKTAPSVYLNEGQNESEKRVSNSKTLAVTSAPSVYLNESESGLSAVKDPINRKSGSKLQSPATHQPVLDEYVNEVRPDQTRNGAQAKGKNQAKSPQPSNSAHSVSQTSQVYENDAQLAYEEIPVTRHEPKSATSGKQGTPLPPVPTEKTKNHKAPKNLLGRKQDGGKKQSIATPETDIWDEGDYLEPEDESGWRKPSTEIPRKDTRKWKTLSEIPKNVEEFSISDVSLCLELLKLQKYVDKFKERNVDGQFLLKLSKKMLIEGFQMHEFEAKQLFEFAVKKWRPKK